MPATSGVAGPIEAVGKHVGDEVDALQRAVTLLTEVKRGNLSFNSDGETRAEAEVRKLREVIDLIDHTRCPTCDALEAVLPPGPKEGREVVQKRLRG